MRKKVPLLLLISLFLTLNVIKAQLAWLEPADPSPSDTVVLTYNSNKGNKGLEGWKETVYLHTGAITEKSIDGGDWKHVTGNWGEDDANVRMKPLGNGLHQFTFIIDDYYDLRPEEVVQQLAFVFRNRDGSKVGKTSNNEDVFLPVNGFVPTVKEKPAYVYDKRVYQSHSLDNNTLEVLTDHGLVQLVPFTPRIVKVKHFEGSTAVKDSSAAVIVDPSLVATKLDETKDWLRFITDSLQVLIHKDPFYIAFEYQGDTILKEDKGLYKRTDNGGLQFAIDEGEKLYGLGERAIGFSLTGQKYNLYNRPKYAYEMPANNLNYSIPLLVSSKKYMLFFDNPQKGYADVGFTDSEILEWGTIGGLMKYHLIASHSFYDLMEQWSYLTGKQPLPPRWALGNLQSRMAYRTQEETDSIVRLMQENDFPIDAIILDFYWFGDSIQGTMGRLDWYKPNWPDPVKMIADFKSKGVKTVLITEPYIIDSLENFRITDELGILATDADGNSYVNKGFYFGPGALIDIFQPKAREWFWQQYDRQMKNGVAGWWGDLGEPENHPPDQIHVSGTADEVHNIFAQYWHRMLYENYREHYPGKRLFNLNRAGYAGSQRYSIYPWTGDVSRSWGGFQAQLPTMLHMSMCGLPFIHSDAGGFAQGTKDDELYTRWLQFSSFSPILRPHGSVVPSEVVYFSKETQDIVRQFMRIRYSLIPYIYSTAAQSSVRGYPITCPLFFDFPEDTLTYDIVNQYMFGRNLMVAPVLNPGQTEIAVYLPATGWYNFWDDTKYEGGHTLTLATEMETIPVFVREGSFIPMVKPVNSTDDYTSDSLNLRFYPGQTGDTSYFNMFEDDGKTYGTFGRGEFELLRFKAYRENDSKLQIEMIKDGWDYQGMPRIRAIQLEVIGKDPELNYLVKINGDKLKLLRKDKKVAGYYFEGSRLIIKYRWGGDLVNIVVEEK